MLQHQHILLTILFLFPLIIHYDGPLDLILSVSIVLIFSVLPDIDLSGNKFVNTNMVKRGILMDYFKLLNLITNIIRIIIFRPYDFLIKLLLGKSKTFHRESSHSLIFLSVTLAVLLLFIILLSPYLKLDNIAKYIILAILGFTMHLFQDSLTVNGIKWLYPLENVEIKGRLNTSNNLHMRLIDVYIMIIILMIIAYHVIEIIMVTNINPVIYSFYHNWNKIYPNHTYLLAIPLFLLIKEVKISL